MSDLENIQDILNRAYGGMGTGPVDRVAANQILQYLRSAGWTTPDELALIIDAAGGVIEVTEKAMSGERVIFTATHRPEDNVIRFQTRRQS